MDSTAFRKTLSQFATGVTVITSGSGSQRVGMTVSSFNSVSLEPPLILWSIDKSATSHALFCAAQRFVVHVLAADQKGVSAIFAGQGVDKFAQHPTTKHEYGPLISGCAAVLYCSTWTIYPGGDHDIILGRVDACESHAEKQGLIFAQGRYNLLGAQA